MPGAIEQLRDQLDSVIVDTRQNRARLDRLRRRLQRIVATLSGVGGRQERSLRGEADDAVRRVNQVEQGLDEVERRAKEHRDLVELRISGAGAGPTSKPWAQALADEALRRPIDAPDTARHIDAAGFVQDAALAAGAAGVAGAAGPARNVVKDALQDGKELVENALPDHERRWKLVAASRSDADRAPAPIVDAREFLKQHIVAANGRVERAAWTTVARKLDEFTDPRVAPTKVGFAAIGALSSLMFPWYVPFILGRGAWVMVQDAKRRAGMPR